MSVIPSWARKGALVVYVGYDGPDVASATEGPRPQRRCIYTIDSVIIGDQSGQACARLVEIPNAKYVWRLRAFRPLVDDANDNEIEAQIYRNKVHQKPAPIKDLERVE